MLIVRSEQMQGLQSDLERRFVDSLMALLLAHFPTASLPQAAEPRPSLAALPRPVLNILVEGALAQARTYGLAYQAQIGAYVALRILLGGGIDQQTFIRKILGDPQIPPNERLASLWRLTSEHDWAEVQRALGPTDWKPTGCKAQAKLIADKISASLPATPLTAIVGGAETQRPAA